MENNRLEQDGSSEIYNGPYEKTIEINLIELLRLHVRKSRIIFLSAAVVMAVTASISLLTANKYTSKASILPSGTPDRLASLIDLAGSYGFGSGQGSAPENSSALYPSILESNLVKDEVAGEKYGFLHNDKIKEIELSKYFETDDPEELRSALSDIITIDMENKLGIIFLSATTEYPGLSKAILNRYISILESYLIEKRRSRSKESEIYLEKQLNIHKNELAVMEDSLRNFMSVNRNWSTGTNPDLLTELDRLRREVKVCESTYLLLSEQLEMARLGTQKEIPIVRVLDPPSLPTSKSGPFRTMITLFSGLLTVLFLSFWIFISYLWHQTFGDRDEKAYSNLRHDLIEAVPQSRRILNIINKVRKERQPAGSTER